MVIDTDVGGNADNRDSKQNRSQWCCYMLLQLATAAAADDDDEDDDDDYDNDDEDDEVHGTIKVIS